MTDAAKFDLRQIVRLTAAAQHEWPDMGNLPGEIERVHFSRREVCVWWAGRGVRINLTFDDVEPVA